MRIKRVRIQNFRSIKKIDFYPQKMCALIGANNAGKSNILKALNLLLGETWPSDRSIDINDFHNGDVSNPIEISVWFDEPLIETVFNFYDVKIYGISLIGKVPSKGKNKGSIKVSMIPIDEEGKQIMAPTSPPKKGEKLKFGPFSISKEIRDKVPLIYIGVDRQVQSQRANSQWTLLGKLFRDLDEELKADKQEFDVKESGGNIQTFTRLEAFQHYLQKAMEFLKTDSFKKIEASLQDSISRHLGTEHDNIHVKFGLHDSRTFYRNLQIIVEEYGNDVAATDMGGGAQSAIVMGIFEAYRNLNKSDAIIAIEEPELFLHPHARRFLYSMFEELADSGAQIFYTTHSPDFINVANYENIGIVFRSIDGNTQIKTASNTLELSEKEELRVLAEFDPTRNELFFSKAVVLVEGDTEKMTLPFAFKLNGINIHRENVSIVKCNGKGNIPLFVKVISSFGIPFLVIHDVDIWPPGHKKAHENESQRKKNEKIKEYVSDHGIIVKMDPDFDTVIGGSTKDKVASALESIKSVKKFEELPDELQVVVNEVRKLIGGDVLKPLAKSMEKKHGNFGTASQGLPELDHKEW
jgi:predicted ATP-dependent endonuclease of OLD family